MEVGPQVSALLRSAGTLSEAQLATAAQAAVEAVCGGATAEQALAQHSWAQQQAGRDAVAAVAAVVTHAASLNLSGEQVKGARARAAWRRAVGRDQQRGGERERR